MYKRIPRLLLATAILLALNGCSYSSLFVVVNQTSRPAVVTVALDLKQNAATWCVLEPGQWFTGPVVVPTDQLHRWYELDNTEQTIQFDEANCTVTMTVPPAHSAVVWIASNYFDSGKGLDLFPTRIQIDGSIGRVELEGPGLDRIFVKRSKSLYAIDYGRPAA